MKTARFKLYHSAGLRSARVKWLLHELVGDDFNVEYVDIYGAEQYGSRYLAINSNYPVEKAGREMYMSFDRPAQEIGDDDVTSEMMEAGETVLIESGYIIEGHDRSGTGLTLLAKQVFLAMMRTGRN